MEDSSQNGKPEESITSMNQTKTNDTSEQKMQSEPSKRGVFMTRGKGMSREEFVKVFVKSLKEAGLMK